MVKSSPPAHTGMAPAVVEPFYSGAAARPAGARTGYASRLKAPTGYSTDR